MSIVSKVAEPYAEALLDLAKSNDISFDLAKSRSASAYGSATLLTIDII